MSDSTQQLGGTVQQSIVDPIGRGLTRVLAPIDRTFDPIADRFNRRFGAYVGTMTGLQLFMLLSTLVVLLAAPLWTPYLVGNYMRTLTLAAIWAIFAMGWDFQSGYTGYISFGHSVLSGAAAYATALLVTHVDPGLGLWVTIPVSILAAVVVGLVIGLPSLRLHGPYFSLITFVAVLLFYRLTYAFPGLLGGETGFSGVEMWYTGADPVARYYVMLLPMLAIAVVLTVIARSNVGMILVAIRENEAAVSAAGLDPTKFKLWSFGISSFVMGVGGVMLAHFYGNVDPMTFIVVDNSIEIIAMAVIGGMSSILGALGGAFLFIVLRDEILHGLGHVRWVVLWLLVLTVLVLARDGLFRILWHVVGAIGGDRE
ncbi:branched-chain amino acid ABC transporter permease [Natronobacterium texcoconense]|uniref:Amino acid/amide ABC transporter membrane protein 2, HAAT family n=1 Tax=Natronobacterium texcoconense TaxID=1095778 RepID=A0A1H1BU31_NATTX|nr:branched-chain amino acid ABC transporter permease [Natronobacterium texcoconense]SDQ55250.1 amino acid/amide ABC transporter membrane protein 2, HAAT family [Natronobacterium texcoconense]